MGSTYSTGSYDQFGAAAAAAAGLTGMAAGGAAHAAGAYQQHPQQPQHLQQQQLPAASSLGFDDAAFGPVDDWRVLGDVQQWHRALLTKEKVCLRVQSVG